MSGTRLAYAAPPALSWCGVSPDHMTVIDAIGQAIHTLYERAEILAEKVALFPEGCGVLASDGRIVGYGISHPWRVGEVPALDTFLDALPLDPDCIFIHDVAIQPEARRRGALQRFVAQVSQMARNRELAWLALVSVYGTVPLWERCGFHVTALPPAAKALTAYGPTARYMVSDIRDQHGP